MTLVFIRLFKAFIYKQVNCNYEYHIYSVPLLELSINCGYCKTGHFALKKDVWKEKVEYFLEEFLCWHTGAREKVKEVKKIEADEAEKQKKEKSVDACRGSDNNIHCVRLESENCLIVALKNTPFEKLVGPLLYAIHHHYLFPTYHNKQNNKRWVKTNKLFCQFCKLIILRGV